jgi:hypothetical protein
METIRNTLGGWERGLSPQTINSFRQNSPELIVRDARRMLNLNDEQCEILRQILLARGVNKWFKARRDIIKLQHELKKQIKEFQKKYHKWDPVHKASLKLLNDFRERLREICHQPRWVEWPKIADPREAEKEIVVKGPMM